MPEMRKDAQTSELTFTVFRKIEIIVSDKASVQEASVHRTVLLVHPVPELFLISGKCRKCRGVLGSKIKLLGYGHKALSYDFNALREIFSYDLSDHIKICPPDHRIESSVMIISF